MRVRIKFTKNGPLKFVGHLDVMRYFQKAIRRADLPAAYSEGFNPHMIMSFAYPLGVGVTSSGEYFDLDLTCEMPTAMITSRLNETMAEGIEIVSTIKIPENKNSKGMSLVAAADYLVTFREGLEPEADYKKLLEGFLSQPSIIVLKKTKKSETETDIRPMIYAMELRDDGIFMQVSSGSANNLKPELVMEAFYRFMGEPLQEFAWMIHRLEIYADIGNEKRNLVPLGSLGEAVE